jgi:hypothetical protein
MLRPSNGATYPTTRAQAEQAYGPIADWDVSAMTSLNNLFSDCVDYCFKLFQAPFFPVVLGPGPPPFALCPTSPLSP